MGFYGLVNNQKIPNSKFKLFSLFSTTTRAPRTAVPEAQFLRQGFYKNDLRSHKKNDKQKENV